MDGVRDSKDTTRRCKETKMRWPTMFEWLFDMYLHAPNNGPRRFFLEVTEDGIKCFKYYVVPKLGFTAGWFWPVATGILILYCLWYRRKHGTEG